MNEALNVRLRTKWPWARLPLHSSLYSFPCPDLGLFISYLYYRFFILVSIFIMINRLISWTQTDLFFFLFLENVLLFSLFIFIFFIFIFIYFYFHLFLKSSVSGCCLAFAWFLANLSLAFLAKVLLLQCLHCFKVFSVQFSWQNENFVDTSKELLKNRN